MSKNNYSDSNRNSHNLTPWEQYQAQQGKKVVKDNKWASLFRAKKSTPKSIKPHHFHSHNKNEQMWFFSILTSLLLLLLIMIYLSSPISKIKQVQIIGSDVISNSSLQRDFSFGPGHSIFNIYGKKKVLSDQIKQKYPQFKNVEISTKSLNHVKVSLSEYRVEGYLQVEANYKPILSNGVVLDKSIPSRQESLPILRKFNQRDKLKLMLNQYRQISSTIQSMISLIDFAPTSINPERIHLYMKNKNQVYASIGTLADKMQYYPSISSKNKEPQVINFELGAYSYPLGQDDDQTTIHNKKQPVNTKDTKKNNKKKTTTHSSDTNQSLNQSSSNQSSSSQNSNQQSDQSSHN